MHEIAHLLGVDHCIWYSCCMNGSGHLSEDFGKCLLNGNSFFEDTHISVNHIEVTTLPVWIRLVTVQKFVLVKLLCGDLKCPTEEILDHGIFVTEVSGLMVSVRMAIGLWL